jgi:tetratricopeptide (TPR) repeat protein
VHRLPGERGGVFAWSHELTAWLNSAAAANGKAQDSPPPAAVTLPPPPQPLAPAQPAPPPRRTLLWTATIVAAILAVLAGSLLFLHQPSRAIAFLRTTRSAAPHHTPDPVAQDFYLKGRYYWSRRTEGSLRQAIDAFTQAVVHDPEYAQAYAGLAECYDLMPEFSSMPGSEAFPRAIAAAQKAVALDGSLAEAHRALGFALFYWEWKVPAALGEFQRAIQLDPRDEEAHHWYATSLLTLGRYQEAEIEIDKAQQLNPASGSILSDQALIRYWNGDQGPAIEKLKEIEQAEPDFLSAPRYLAGIAFDRRDYRTWIVQSKRLAALAGDRQLLDIANAAQRGLATGGEHGLLEAIRVVQQRYFDSGQSSGVDLARTCARLGRKQEAVADLKAAFAAHDYMVLTVASSPDFAPLSGDPAFEELLRQITARLYRA